LFGSRALYTDFFRTTNDVEPSAGTTAHVHQLVFRLGRALMRRRPKKTIDVA
jgi:hypothetical protein